MTTDSARGAVPAAEHAWRRPLPSQFSGMPAWGVPGSRIAAEAFGVSPFPALTPQWAWGGSTGAGVRVAVVDSGIDGTNPQVGTVDRSVTVVQGDSGRVSVEDAEAVDLAGHGTACAGVIRELAPDASISSVRVLTDGKYGSGEALIAGLNWAIDQGYDVINLSASTRKQALQAALYEASDRAYFRRCTLVVSANNLPVHGYPWSFSSVFSVASHDEPDSMLHYYNPSPPVEFLARGVAVEVAWSGGGRMRLSGNSFAAPHVAAKCALILAKHPWLTPFQLKSVLYHTAPNVTAPTHTALEGKTQ